MELKLGSHSPRCRRSHARLRFPSLHGKAPPKPVSPATLGRPPNSFERLFMAGESFQIKGADGKQVSIPAGEYYFNSKARCRRMMLNSLSSDARRVYACLELGTMGFQQELAVVQIAKDKQRPLGPLDIREQTGLLRQNVRRGLEELEKAGLAQRVAVDGGPLQKGKVLLYSWAVPQKQAEKFGNRARLPNPAWDPDRFPGLENPSHLRKTP